MKEDRDFTILCSWESTNADIFSVTHCCEEETIGQPELFMDFGEVVENDSGDWGCEGGRCLGGKNLVEDLFLKEGHPTSRPPVRSSYPSLT